MKLLSSNFFSHLPLGVWGQAAPKVKNETIRKKHGLDKMEGKEVEVAGGYVEIAFTLPRLEARAVARRYLDRYPKVGYDTHVANWYETTDKKIHFTMRRLSNCD